MIMRILGSLDFSRRESFSPIILSLNKLYFKKIDYLDSRFGLYMNSYMNISISNLHVYLSKLAKILQLIFGLTKAGLVPDNEIMVLRGRCFFRTAVEAGFGVRQRETKLQAKIRWHSMTEFERADPLLVAVAAAAGKSEAQLDQMFRSWSRL